MSLEGLACSRKCLGGCGVSGTPGVSGSPELIQTGPHHARCPTAPAGCPPVPAATWHSPPGSRVSFRAPGKSAPPSDVRVPRVSRHGEEGGPAGSVCTCFLRTYHVLDFSAERSNRPRSFVQSRPHGARASPRMAINSAGTARGLRLGSERLRGPRGTAGGSGPTPAGPIRGPH